MNLFIYLLVSARFVLAELMNPDPPRHMQLLQTPTHSECSSVAVSPIAASQSLQPLKSSLLGCSPHSSSPHSSPQPKSPQEPRKKRVQVKRACSQCAKACKKCDDQRPCSRCLRFGVAEQCHDSPRRRRRAAARLAVLASVCDMLQGDCLSAHDVFDETPTSKHNQPSSNNAYEQYTNPPSRNEAESTADQYINHSSSNDQKSNSPNSPSAVLQKSVPFQLPPTSYHQPPKANHDQYLQQSTDCYFAPINLKQNE